ncbi:MAG TPA: zinc-dependent metalloprotease, partial [Candidatus Acidoferrales bacterium]
MVQPNYSYRATSDNPAERRAVEQAFAQSVLWGFEVAAEDGDHILVDATAFYLRDAHNVTGTLRRSNQGQYRLDATRSAIYLPRTRNFPKNTEVEATLTFTSDQPGGLVRSVAPSAQAVTLRQHHSFFELPDSNYTPRAFDPRAGYGGRGYMDFATPISEPIGRRFIARHRLQKKTPSAVRSEPVEPIVYYVDRGAPEPIRTALIEGAQWWNQAFEAAGFINGFRVEVMPEDADPMDARYNIIQWVHRSTRGWSYGASVSDPRTSEIIKGHVTLGSLRVRQDFLIAEGLVAAYEEGQPVPPEIERMALARIRQLSAHEVGHTLGLSHNYISSTVNRASVMDYPHPLARLRDDGTVDLSDAYAEGIGEWDKVAINWGYREFASGASERTELNKILMDAAARGIIFLTDQDARPQSSSHSKTHLWDNGENAVDELRRVLGVRAAVLRGFSEKKIRPGMPMATIEDVLVPMYLFHRYQVEAAAKVVGGLDYTFTLRGDGQLTTQIVKPEEQRRALDAVLETIQPSTLALPEALIAMIPPRPPGYFRSREQFRVRTGATFDPVGAAAAAADLPVMLLLNAERAARLVEFHARDARNPGFGEVVDRLLNATWKAQRGAGLDGEIRRAVDMVVLYRLMALAANTRISPQVRAVAMYKLDELRQWLAGARAGDESQRAHVAFAAMQIELFLKDPKEPNLPQPPSLPDGAPIGATDDDCSWVDVGTGDERMPTALL